MLRYVLFAIIIIFSIEGIQFNNKKIKRLSQILIIGIFYLIAGMSYKIHNDFFIYEAIYERINFVNLKYTDFEKGYVILNAIFNNFLEFYNFKSLVYLVNTFFIYKGLKKILKQEKIYIVLALMYLLFNQFYYLYLSAFRQSIAITIFIYSISYIKDRKLLKYSISILLAFFFHKSVLILYPIYFIFNYKLKIKMWLNIFLYLTLNILSLIPQIQYKIIFIFYKVVSILGLGKLSESYLFKENSIEIKNMILLLCLMIFYKFLSYKKEDYFINKLLFCYIVIEVLSNMIGIFYRVEIYFTVFYCIFLTELILYCNKSIIFKLLKISLILFIGLNYNIKIVWSKYKDMGTCIPLYFTFERFYKDIKYENTAEFKHLLNRISKTKSNNTTNLNELKNKEREKIIKN